MEASVREAAKAGATAIKVWKNLGLTLRDGDGELVTVDDPRLESLWRTAGEVDLPVVIHVADPVAFFAPLDERNERLGELRAHPDWWFGGGGYGLRSFHELISQLDTLIGDYPQTTFVGAHMGCYAEDLPAVGWRDARSSPELCDRHERADRRNRTQGPPVHDFFVRYADRILSDRTSKPDRRLMQPEGCDRDSEQEFFDAYWRYFESEEEQLQHPLPIQGAWPVTGIDLPDSVLQALYFDNAVRILLRLRP